MNRLVLFERLTIPKAVLPNWGGNFRAMEISFLSTAYEVESSMRVGNLEILTSQSG